MAHIPSARYGIAEWYGKDITALTSQDRQELGRIATTQSTTSDLSGAPICPFLSTLVLGVRCNKTGGVCSIRKFTSGPDGSGVTVPNDKIVTVCPSRFLQQLSKNKNIFGWISEKMLDIQNPILVKETPFLRKVADVQRPVEAAEDMEAEAEEEGKKAGRIDWIIVNPTTMAAVELEWCAVETQALYFSGGKMRPEFEAYAAQPSPILFPVGRRRPDYRSSGPKRLWPQLDVKVPVLRNWGKKVAIVIDRYFYENMNSLDDAYPRARNDGERRDNADVVWFIVDYNENLDLKEGTVIFTTLDSSRRALNATEPLSKADFTNNLKRVIKDVGRANKVFKALE